MFSGKFGITLGKFDLYGNGDTNEFAGGRGRTQFQNWSLNYGTAAIFVPASTLGAGLVYLPSENLTISQIYATHNFSASMRKSSIGHFLQCNPCISANCRAKWTRKYESIG